MGAIIAFEQDANLLEFVKSEGVPIESQVTRELLVSLFVPESVNKLHDGAVLIRDSELTGDRLATDLRRLVQDRETLIRMSVNARRFARPDAAERIARGLLEWARQGKGRRAPEAAGPDVEEA